MEVRTILHGRQTAVEERGHITTSIKGHLKVYGIKLGNGIGPITALAYKSDLGKGTQDYILDFLPFWLICQLNVSFFSYQTAEHSQNFYKPKHLLHSFCIIFIRSFLFRKRILYRLENKSHIEYLKNLGNDKGFDAVQMRNFKFNRL
jgi:hypothetical protein